MTEQHVARAVLDLLDLANTVDRRGMPDLEDRLRGQFASFFTLSRKDNLTTEQLEEEEPDASVKSSALSDSQSEDDDLGQTYDSPPDTTYLEFSHNSVRDFLLQEGNPESRKYPTDLGIGIVVIKAELHITTTLLGILCSPDYDSTYPTNNLSSYAANFCLHHLLVSNLTPVRVQEGY